MPTGNVEQIAEWNGALGHRWAEARREIDAVVVPFGAAALERAAPQPGERVIDVGCGCGDTSIELACRVGPGGAVLGIDVSRPMLEVARSRAAPAGAAPLAFREADASDAALPGATDLLFSRFGVMFFDAPAAAFRHLREALRPGGRCVFVCWRTPRDNPWAMTPLAAARQALGIVAPPSDPLAPGPFAFADDARVRAILAEAGFAAVDVQRRDAPVVLGATTRSAAESAARIGPTARLVRDAGAGRLPAVVDAIEAALAPRAAPDGRVALNGSAWIVAASNP